MSAAGAATIAVTPRLTLSELTYDDAAFIVRLLFFPTKEFTRATTAPQRLRIEN